MVSVWFFGLIDLKERFGNFQIPSTNDLEINICHEHNII